VSGHQGQPQLPPPGEPSGPSRAAIARLKRIRADHAFVAYIVLVVTGLIVLRASVDAVSFLSVSWILILAVLPLLPWLLPQLGKFLKTVSPYVQSIKLGAIQLDLRAVQREAITIPSTPMLASLPNDTGALSNSTAITDLIKALRDFRRDGASPAVIIDLRDGHKWRLPNLYYLARLLEQEPTVNQLVFTEIRGVDDGYVIGTCRAIDLRLRFERTVDGYAKASSSVTALPAPLDWADALASDFTQFQNALPPATLADNDPAHGFVTPSMLRTGALRGLADPVAVETASGTLSESDVRTVIESTYQFVPATIDGRLVNLIDRELVALDVARAALRSVAP
jgi:hypothetical protein